MKIPRKKLFNGFTEQLVGRAIQGFPRKKLQLISKVSPQNLRYDDVHRSG